MIDLDAVLSNADWVKRTPDKLSDLEQIVKKGDEKSGEQNKTVEEPTDE